MIQFPRMGNYQRITEYVIRCNCWRCHIPLLRRRHWRRLIEAG